jgi:hypothetical protein
MYADNELLFPPYVVPRLRNSKGEAWQKLVDRVALLPQDDPESLAFSLMMIHINGCLKCETDSYRAMRGCTACARQSLRRYKEPDQELLEQYTLALKEIQAHLHTEAVEHVLERTPSAKAA